MNTDEKKHAVRTVFESVRSAGNAGISYEKLCALHPDTGLLYAILHASQERYVVHTAIPLVGTLIPLPIHRQERDGIPGRAVEKSVFTYTPTAAELEAAKIERIASFWLMGF